MWRSPGQSSENRIVVNTPSDADALHRQIEYRAHELFEARGGQHGRDWEDWFRAEREIRDRSRPNRDLAPLRVVFLFGAGASYGSGNTDPERPPLMAELFDRLSGLYPAEWGSSSSRWADREQYRTNFEAAFTSSVIGDPPFVTNSLTLAEGLWPIARYFARFRTGVNGTDCYSTLVAALANRDRLEQAVFATLNYDCLLEQSVVADGAEVEYCIREWSAPRRGQVRILKLHGSCNFVADIDQHARALLTTARVEVPIRTLWPRELDGQLASLGTRNVLPIISQLSFGKEAVLAPVQIQRIRSHWRDAVNTGNVLVIIGAACHVQDLHVVDIVRQAPAVLYIGGDADFGAWSSLNATTEHIGREFEAALPDLLSRLHLA
jgi:hypothetical protein